MNAQVMICEFSGSFREQGFLQWLQEKGEEWEHLDLRELEGCCCYCDDAAKAAIAQALPDPLPLLRWLDSGDYHYMSHLLALREKEPFHLVLLDHHPDNQEPAFGGVLSCGSWVKAMEHENPLLRDVLSIGPEDCPEDIPEGWMERRRGERVYVSLDKDVMDRAHARTDWTQGTHTLKQVEAMLQKLLDGPMKVVAVDICGENAQAKGATPEDLRINMETNVELYQFLTNQLITQ